MDFLTARAQVLKKDGEFDGHIKVLGSTETRHRSGRVIRQSGWRLDNFRKNPVALYEHDELIGSALVEQTARGLLFDISIAEEGTSATVDWVREMARQGHLRAASVGWLPVEGQVKHSKDGTEFLESELIEISVVTLPDNPDAVKLAASYGVELKETPESDFERQFWDEQIRIANAQTMIANAHRRREIEIMQLQCPRMGAIR